jgi:hypothetical protein
VSINFRPSGRQKALRVLGPQVIERYPYRRWKPEALPGIRAGKIARNAVIVSADPFHHGIIYGDPEKAFTSEGGWYWPGNHPGGISR